MFAYQVQSYCNAETYKEEERTFGTPCIFDFSHYSGRSLHHVPFSCFFLFLVCFNISLHVHSILRHRLHLYFVSLQSRQHWNPTQFGIYTGIEVLQIAAIFWHKGRTWYAPCLWSCASDRELFSAIFTAISFFIMNCA